MDKGIEKQARGISVKMAPMSSLLPSSGPKSHLFNLINTPGVAMIRSLPVNQRPTQGATSTSACLEVLMSCDPTAAFIWRQEPPVESHLAQCLC